MSKRNAIDGFKVGSRWVASAGSAQGWREDTIKVHHVGDPAWRFEVVGKATSDERVGVCRAFFGE